MSSDLFLTLPQLLGRATTDQRGQLAVAPSTPQSTEHAKPARPPLAGRWRTESGRGRLEITETSNGQLSWEYESTDGGSLYQTRGTGYVDGDRLELTGAFSAGDGYSLSKPFTLTLRRDGPQLVGTSAGALNNPRLLRFSKEP
jgi:hypothetical protein